MRGPPCVLGMARASSLETQLRGVCAPPCVCVHTGVVYLLCVRDPFPLNTPDTSSHLGTLSYWSRPFRTFGVTSKFAAMFSLTLVGVNEVKLEPMVLHLLLGFDRTQSINAVPE